MNFFSFNFHRLREAGMFAASPASKTTANEKDIKMIEGCLRPGKSLPLTSQISNPACGRRHSICISKVIPVFAST